MADGRYLFQVTEEYEEERIDKYVSMLIDSLSRSFIQKLLREGQVLVNGNPVKQNCRLKEGDEVSFSLPEAVEPDIQPEDIPLDILYEDDDVLVVNKPKGMVVHPAAGHYSHTLVNALMYHCRGSLSGINGVMRPGIVHRIDRDTTGSLLVCKNDAAHLSIAAQLKEHSIVRRYRAVVYGEIGQEEGVISLPIGRDPHDRKRMAAGVKNGKEAVTHYRVLEQFQKYSYIECRLETGRTHQIRVHMEAIGHPLLGDEVYRRNIPGNGKLPCQLQGQTLHAMILGFRHPRTGEYIETTAPLPPYFSHLLEILRQ
ncbi:MAG TPA: RluA family pseudouridine synthase [Candidatus Eisenbergiella merdipullorum]|uniref:Pseudouridine synthase n=1 Tax=Candidatus Eisenbergiella merdipullorum TaxID=2838553 RepID=A0A9D2L0P0_9FIRM|nr:RluA family pseudouridine synthase [Candidatus Eisenbergiella merdipullorum]